MRRFGSLKEQRAAAVPPVKSAGAVAAAPALPIRTKRGNPAYQQFSAYLPKELYREFKAHLARNGLELSDAIEQAVAD